MLQGTGSHVGKSLLVTGLCRVVARRGLAVRPFKPQNMSNNAAVTPDGGEIGRAQALQARACGVAASVHMNPVLLKPQTEVGAQLVVQGKVRGSFQARDYAALKSELMEPVLESYAKLGREADRNFDQLVELDRKDGARLRTIGVVIGGLCDGSFLPGDAPLRATIGSCRERTKQASEDDEGDRASRHPRSCRVSS